MKDLEVRLQGAVALLQQGQLAAGRAGLAELELLAPQRADIAQWAAIAAARQGDLAAAQQAITRAIRNAPQDASLHLTAANIAQDRRDPAAALEHAAEAVRLRPDFAEAHNNRGILLSDLGRFEEAVEAFRAALRAKRGYARAHANLANALLRLDRIEEASTEAAEAARLQPDNPHALHMLGQAHMLAGRDAKAEEAFRRALARHPGYVEVALLLSRLLLRQRRSEEQAQVVREALRHAPERAELWSAMVDIAGAADDEAGMDLAVARCLALKPDDLAVTARRALYVPSIYRDAAHVDAVRARVEQGVAQLWDRREILLAGVSRANVHNVLQGNFFLGYQGRDDKAVQRQYADLVQAVLQKALPEYCQPIDAAPVIGRRIRIGFASRFFYVSTAGNYFASWVTDLPRDRFEVFVYYSNAVSDALTESIRARADHFFQRDTTLQAFAARIQTDCLDVLVYPEIGMEQLFFLLSALRLAPVQLCAWGHPVTPGHRNLDGYFSCSAMEPADAQQHYNEPLHLLPGIGTRYPHPSINAQSRAKQRADFQLPEDRVLALLPQSLFKIHPDNDVLIVRILKELPQAVLVMFAGQNSAITQRFVARLSAAFAAQGLDPAGRVKILPALPHEDYKRVNELCDFMIDTLHWSGGNTSLDALAFGLPLVTLPGAFMRGRQSMGMLQLLDLPELIARDADEFVRIAVRLGRDGSWRGQLRTRILERCRRLFDDPAPPRAFASAVEALLQRRAKPPA